MDNQIDSQITYSDRTFEGTRQDRAQIVGCTFYDCVLVRCNFIESVLRGCKFVRCLFRQCDLSLSQVMGTSFTSTQFEDCKLIGIDWTQAHWSETRLVSPVGFLQCAISHSTFIGLDLTEIRIEDCVAVDVDFREANLTRAVFAGSDLANSIFGNTNLTEADLSRAHNYWIDPGRCTLRQAKFSLPEAMSLLYAMDITLVDTENA
ncbi:MAG: pentapeptide repeat-containing protein [Chloroflexi bacterium]|nr:pentapeptide repeat-containing protein [Chloroflexota bacterium]